MATLTDQGVSLVVLNMGGDVVDTSTAIGKLLITVLAGISEFEADLIHERQIEGIVAAKAGGCIKDDPELIRRITKAWCMPWSSWPIETPIISLSTTFVR